MIMTDNKFTDAEIIKALECCINDDDDLFACVNKACPFMDYKTGKRYGCTYYMLKAVLSLINRQKAEIERLQAIVDSFTDIGKLYSEIKAEAIKEFAERLKAEFLGDEQIVNIAWANAINHIDNLVKEMVGDDNDR
jgi:hypothetical protein